MLRGLDQFPEESLRGMLQVCTREFAGAVRSVETRQRI